MTHPHPAPVPLLPRPSARPWPGDADLDTCVRDIEALWALAHDQHRTEEAREVLRRFPGARTDLQKAQQVQGALRTLLAQPLTPDPWDVMDEPDALPPAEAVVVGEDDEGEAPDEATVDPEATTATSLTEDVADPEAPPASLPQPVASVVKVERVRWADEHLGAGLISALVRSLAVGESVQLVLARTSDDTVLATVVPQRLPGEVAATARAWQVQGAPRELDAALLEAAPVYVQARRTARDLAEELLAGTQAAATQTRAAQTKATEGRRAKTPEKAPKADKSEAVPAVPPARPRASLTPQVAPPEAGVTVTSGGVAFHVRSGAPFTLDPGVAKVRVEAEGYEPHEEEVTLAAHEERTVTVNLRPTLQGELF